MMRLCLNAHVLSLSLIDEATKSDRGRYYCITLVKERSREREREYVVFCTIFNTACNINYLSILPSK